MTTAAEAVTSGSYYYIVSSNAWNYSDQTNAVYASNDRCRWGKINRESAAYIWQFTQLKSGNYSVKNLLTGTYINNIAESQPCYLTTKSSSAVTLTELTGDQLNLMVVEGGSGSHQMHCHDHDNGNGRAGEIVGWSSGANGPSAWRLEEVDAQLVERLQDQVPMERDLMRQQSKLLQRISDVSAEAKWAFRCELPADATDVTPQSAQDFESNAAMLDGAPRSQRHGVSWGNDGSGYGALIDGRLTTYFHTVWNGTSIEWSAYNADKTPAEDAQRTTLHNLSMHLSKPASKIAFQLTARADNNYNNPTKIDIQVSHDGTTWQTVFFGYDFYTPNIHPETPYLIGPIDLGGEYEYVRLANYANDHNHNGKRFFCLSELKVFDGARLSPDCQAAKLDAEVVSNFLAAYSEANRYADVVTVDDIEAIKAAITQLNTAYNAFKAKFTVATFTNPVLNEDGPDPSVIRGHDGYYYLFSTAEHVYRSKDMVNWTYVRQAFGNNPRPTFVPGVNVYWAPCVTEQDGRYVLYFALSTWGGGATASIGVATSDTPDGPYRLVGDGKLFTSGEVGVENSIDPCYVEDNGKKYIIWGSWNGIWMLELTDDGLAVKDIKKKRKIADTRFEAAYIYKRGSFYYLFCSIGACCEGLNSTYQTVVGRSTSLLGTFVTRDGKRMLDNAYRLFLNSSNDAVGPGHNSRIIEDEKGQTWMFYHAYRRDDGDRGRVVWLDRVLWDNEGWPYVEGGGPSAVTKVAPTTTPSSLTPSEVHPEWGARNASLTPVDLQNNGHMNLFLTGVRGEANEEQDAEPYSLMLHSDGAGQWTGESHALKPGIDASIVPCDINGDGWMDLVAFGRTASATDRGIFLGNADGTLRQQPFTVEGGDAGLINQCAVADVNNDGLTDLIVVGNRQNAVLLQHADFRFQAVPFNNDATYLAVRAADFSGDGLTDIFAYGPQAAELYVNDGTGTAFSATGWSQQFPIPTDGSVAIADFSFNANLDIFIAGAQSTLCINQGDGTFKVAAPRVFDSYALNNGNWSATSAQAFDWNTDNYFDLFYQGDDNVLGTQSGGIWLRKSGGVFSRDLRYAAGSGGATAIMDWNEDGLPDIISTGYCLDAHLLPDSKERGLTFAVTLGRDDTPKTPRTPTQPQATVQGNRVTLSWEPVSMKNATYEVFIRDETGCLLGDCRSYVGGERDGQRKCLALGHLSNISAVTYTLPAGHYTWGVQSINANLVGSPFATGEFQVEGDDAIASPANQLTSLPQFYNVLGQRINTHKKGLRIVRYNDGTARKQLTR